MHIERTGFLILINKVNMYNKDTILVSFVFCIYILFS